MALVLGDLYIALLDAGVSEDKAKRASEEVLIATRRPMTRAGALAFASSRASSLVLPYMLGIATGLTVALLALVR